MPRVVLDANVFVSALIKPEGVPGRLLSRWLGQRTFELVVSPPIVAELRRALRYPRVRRYLALPEREVDAWIAAVQVLGVNVAGAAAVHVALDDPDDAKYLAAALDGRADILVSGDRHLLALGEYEGIRILKPRQFLDELSR